jgi:hypothetical protein
VELYLTHDFMVQSQHFSPQTRVCVNKKAPFDSSITEKMAGMQAYFVYLNKVQHNPSLHMINAVR